MEYKLSYTESVTRQEELLKSLEAFLVSLSPFTTYIEESSEQALFEADILVRCLELHKRLKEDLRTLK